MINKQIQWQIDTPTHMLLGIWVSMIKFILPVCGNLGDNVWKHDGVKTMSLLCCVESKSARAFYKNYNLTVKWWNAACML